jgi:hypothetical protein
MIEPTVVPLHHVDHFSAIEHRGDYLFVEDGRVVMACPACGTIFICPHTVVQREPLTLSPSVVGPNVTQHYDGDHWTEQVQGPCHHHFWVKDGKALDVV